MTDTGTVKKAGRGRLAVELLIVALLNILVIQLLSAAGTSVSALSRVGSRGEEVTKIQQVLKNQGLYTGKVDGVFGNQTQAAVKAYQKKNGLTADGIAGAQTLKKMGITSSSSGGTGKYSANDVTLLARIISAEARGEPYTGQVAVGAVVLNRVSSPSFPNTISGVIYQKGAFTAVTDGQFNQPVSDSAKRAAQDAMNGWDPSGGALYYFNPAKTSNAWMRSRPVLLTIGSHKFCK